ncbi:D-glycerate dehydrogenase [Xanthomonas fragariae]|uniref:2-hydroxyacid dehydrogenase n=1 Tax=Xanthomonas fragariae TaxID=48664 RepID=A0A1Y6HHV0_9XANT|nr:D-glycerate dehydrogenase [Xanthomonas fragariae]AOD14788.1 D-glycerate dehydrogenase [Xanthomonas fragariae]AOD18182.1 D-glycerate dehydrogenase [Xanthomonas fragariae]ENZ96398.1 glyoxylate reductase [Xanthomonas fragariae LMG 25863]MBL9195805.1 D-glycerate dehydrogenase [Xanthomonas fragariae]MBL9220686.1 D-glycerate dehydrogenase [Xanthomonas fragariae]
MSESRRAKVWVSQPLFDDVLAQLGEHFELTITERVTAYSPADLAARLASQDGALLTLNERIGAAQIACAPQLRAIANVGVGYNNLDIDALSAAGILASNTPDVLTETTADLGFAFLMATARRITESERWLRDGQCGQWSFKTMLGADIHGSTLGILGMGRIGQGIARRGAHGFGMRVLYHNRSQLPAHTEQALGAQYVDVETLLAHADHLVLALPSTKQSHHIIDAAALGKMRPTATLVNIARGGLVDELALADVLADGRLAGAGLDVYEGEPAVRPELLALQNVVLTPHIGSASLATRRAMVQLAVDNLIAALGAGPNAGHPPSALNADAVAAAKQGGKAVGTIDSDAINAGATETILTKR